MRLLIAGILTIIIFILICTFKTETTPYLPLPGKELPGFHHFQWELWEPWHPINFPGGLSFQEYPPRLNQEKTVPSKVQTFSFV